MAWNFARFLIAAAAVLVLWKMGSAVLRSLAMGQPPPPPDGELRKVNLLYRCSVCAAEVKMTRASEELPEPPRHCMDEMELVAPPLE